MNEVPDGSMVKMSISRDMKCIVYDLEVTGSNPGWVERRVHSTPV